MSCPVCPVCNGTGFSVWREGSRYGIVTCDTCGLGITTPFPSAEEIAEANREIYQVESRIQTYESKRDYFINRYRNYVTKIKKFCESGKLLDIGCNIGLFLNVAQEEGFDTVGIEINKECAEYGRQKHDLTVYSEYLENIPFAEESFDVITLFDVLEHIPDLESFIASTKKILKKNGVLLVQVPNLDSLMADMTGAKWNWLSPDHLYHFTPKSIAGFIESHGFKVEKILSWEPPDEFASNVLSVYKEKSLLAKLLFFLNKKCSIAVPVVSLAQGLWWKKQRGGLLELYARKI